MEEMTKREIAVKCRDDQERRRMKECRDHTQCDISIELKLEYEGVQIYF